MRSSPDADQSAGSAIGVLAGTRADISNAAAASHRRDFRVDRGHPMNAKAELEEYFREAESWDTNRVEQALRSVKLAGWTAAAGWTCAVACAAALLLLMPLKRVEPFVVRVDNTTGIVDVVPIYDGRATPQEAVTRYFLTHYVTTCERFNFATAESDYEECGAFHSPARNQIWYSQWTATNPASPLNVHKDGSTVRAQVTSVSFFTRANGITDLAQVRYLKALRQGAGSEEIFSRWVATIQYSYSEPAKDPKIRRWNPLGFKVVEFKTEPEVQVDGQPDKDHPHDS
jgi:type IV secretion system protein VirB8